MPISAEEIQQRDEIDSKLAGFLRRYPSAKLADLPVERSWLTSWPALKASVERLAAAGRLPEPDGMATFDALGCQIPLYTLDSVRQLADNPADGKK